jgi:hypothetical protein
VVPSSSSIQTMMGKNKTSHSSVTITEITAIQLGIHSAHLHTPLYFGCLCEGHTGMQISLAELQHWSMSDCHDVRMVTVVNINFTL